MSAALVPVTVPGAPNIMGQIVNGEPYVIIKPMCDAMNVDVDGQRRKLNQAEWAVTELISATGADGKQYQMFALHADCIPMWLATINTNKVAEHARPVLVAYQREAARALRDYFYRGIAVQSAPEDPEGALAAAVMTYINHQVAQKIAEAEQLRLADPVWLTASGWTRKQGLPADQASAKSFGVRASAVGRSMGIEPRPVEHERWGTVNSWPPEVWERTTNGD
jgi:hypothetical protein